MSHQLQEFLLPLDNIFSSLLNEKDGQREWLGVVCFLIIENHVILIKRSDEMPTHRGQMALVGGHKKDEETILDAALREYFEELSLTMTPNFIGYLPAVKTTLKNSIIPVVCELSIDLARFLREVKSNGEWVELFAVPMQVFYDISNWGHGNRIQNDSKPIFFFPIKAYTYQSHSGENKEYLNLWGATAQMVLDFVTRVPRENFIISD